MALILIALMVFPLLAVVFDLAVKPVGKRSGVELPELRVAARADAPNARIL